MAQQDINVGSNPNDGTGDPLRTAMIKTQNNFSEVYSGLAFNKTTNNVTAANTLSVVNKVQVGTAAGYNFGTNAIIEIDASQNTYVQSVIQNANSGTNASGDLVITNDTGNDSVNFIDLGINSSTYNNTQFSITSTGDGYLYTSNGHLVQGTASNKDIIFHAGGTLATNRVLTVNSSYVTVANLITIVANNATLTAASIGAGQATINSTGYYTTGMVNATSFNIGHASSNAYVNSTAINITNSSSNTTINQNSIIVSNASVNTIIANTTGLYVASNTFNLGTGTNAANGYLYLPNGMKMNWGWVTANNSTGGNVTFTSAYTTNAYSVTATSNNATQTYQAAVVSTNNTIAVIRTGNSNPSDVFWQAIGY